MEEQYVFARPSNLICAFVMLAILPLSIAHAAIENKVENGSFYAATGGVIHEWEKCNPALADNGVPTKYPVPCNFGPTWTDPGSFTRVSQGSLSCSVSPDTYFARITPDSGKNVSIRQRFITGSIIGRTLTVNVCLRRPMNFGNRTATVKLAWKTEGGGYATCVSDTFAPGVAFAQESFECVVPDPTDPEEDRIYSDSYIEIETSGSSGSIDIDAVQVLGSDTGPTWSINCMTGVNCRVENLPSITSSDEIATVSTRAEVMGTDGFVIREVYVTDAVGGNAKRITTQPSSHKYGQMHPAVSPDRSKVAVVRFTEDWDSSGWHSTLTDPQSVWILDTVNDVGYQLTPDWQDGGLAGVAWDTDSTHLYYSVELGRQTRMYKVNTSTLSATVMSDTDVNDWEAELDLSRDGDLLIFAVKPRNLDGTYEKKQRIYQMEVADAPCGSCASREQLTDISDDPGDAPASVGFPVGDYDPQFSPDGTEILWWRNRLCESPGCDTDTQGWSIEKCSLSDDCTDDGNVDRLVDGGVGGTSDYFFLIPDWGDPAKLPMGVRPIIVGVQDNRTTPTDLRYLGIYSMDEDGSSQLKTQQGKGYTDNCLGSANDNQCDAWPRFIDR